MNPLLSLCMIVKNEADFLGQCLDSVQDAVDEMVIVDTGSTDVTPNIARAYGAKIVTHPWHDDFSAARNAGLAQATGNWILQLDADEIVSPESSAQLRPLLAHTTADALRVRIRNLLPPGELRAYDDFFLPRLFRNRPDFRFEQPIHEQIRPSIERAGGRIADSNLTILHYGYARQTAQGGQSRARRNWALLQKALAATPNDAYLLYQAGATCKALGDEAGATAYLQRALAGAAELEPAVQDKLLMKLAQLALAADDFAATVQYGRQSLALNPDNIVSKYVVALALMFQGDVRGAYPWFQQIRQAADTGLTNIAELDAVLDFCQKTLRHTAPSP